MPFNRCSKDLVVFDWIRDFSRKYKMMVNALLGMSPCSDYSPFCRYAFGWFQFRCRLWGTFAYPKLGWRTRLLWGCPCPWTNIYRLLSLRMGIDTLQYRAIFLFVILRVEYPCLLWICSLYHIIIVIIISIIFIYLKCNSRASVFTGKYGPTQISWSLWLPAR